MSIFKWKKSKKGDIKMNKSNWWSNAADRAFIVKKLEIPYESLRTAPQDADAVRKGFVKLLTNKAENLDQENSFNVSIPADRGNLFEHAAQVYSEIVIYNHMFKLFIDDRLGDTKAGNMAKAIWSSRNMKSYAERVVDFAKTLKELDVTEIDEVKEVLPALRFFMFSPKEITSPDGTVEIKDPMTEITKTSEAVIKDILKDWDSFAENIHNKIFVDEVETKLNEL